MLRFHFIILLFIANIAAEADLFYSDPSSSNVLFGPEQSNTGDNFDDVLQSIDSSSFDFDINTNILGSSDAGSDDPMLFADVPYNTCTSSISSPLAFGKARRRRRDNIPAQCSAEGQISPKAIPNLSPSSVEGALATPTDYEKSSCAKGGLFAAIAFLVCASNSLKDTRPGLWGGFILFHSTRGNFLIVPREVSFWACVVAVKFFFCFGRADFMVMKPPKHINFLFFFGSMC